MNLVAKLTDRFWHYFFLNPVAWFLLLLLIVVVYENYKLNRQLDTVCDWIKSPDEFIDKPNNAYAKAQNICGDRLDSAAPSALSHSPRLTAAQ
jgi:hypothetical protein